MTFITVQLYICTHPNLAAKRGVEDKRRELHGMHTNLDNANLE